MKLSSNKLFTYPVLWFVNDDYVDTDFNISLQVDYYQNELVIKYKVKLKNKEILELIESGKACYTIHIENSLTSYRICHFTSKTSGTIRINQDNVNNKIEVSTFIIAKEDIIDYTNTKFNDYYKGMKFDLKKGYILAIGDQTSIVVDKYVDDKGDKESIFSFLKLKEDGPMEYEIESEKILIKLGKSDFEKLNMLQSSRNEKIIHSVFIYPALVFVFETLMKNELGSYSENLWFRSLEKVLNTKGIQLDKESLETRTSFKLAQSLLEMPISETLNSLLEGEDEFEN